MSLPPYALVSPVRNEAKYIRFTLDSVIAQTHLPQRWVIVSDGSTDETDNIVREYAAKHPFIQLVRREPEAGRNFGSKVRAIQEGVSHLADVAYDFLGNLDGDVSFAPDYFAQILERFRADDRLGIAGGILYDDHHGAWRRQIITVDSSVAGPVQLFRRQCYEQIGGYTPLPYGGVDAVAEGMARMHGWSVRTFPEIAVRHHRRVGTEGKGALRAFYDMGRREHVIGYHPLFGLVRTLSRMRAVPWIIGGLCYGTGFFHAKLNGLKPAVPDDYVQFLRREQMNRLTRRQARN
jgi:poly-beta-1,6-N-acetyl-D-glucosamine synthase